MESFLYVNVCFPDFLRVIYSSIVFEIFNLRKHTQVHVEGQGKFALYNLMYYDEHLCPMTVEQSISIGLYIVLCSVKNISFEKAYTGKFALSACCKKCMITC